MYQVNTFFIYLMCQVLNDIVMFLNVHSFRCTLGSSMGFQFFTIRCLGVVDYEMFHLKNKLTKINIKNGKICTKKIV